MRAELLLNPAALLERLGSGARSWRRHRRLRGTPAGRLHIAHYDTLELLDIAEERAGAPSVVYDVGAEAGLFTVLARSRFPGCTVHAFEPLPEHHDRYRARVGAMERTALHTVALGAASSELPMHVTRASEASSFFPVADPGNAPVAERRVPVVRLDEYVALHGLPHPDLIKLDVQGYELEALRGGLGALSHARHVVAEVSFRELYVGQPLFHDVAAFLAERGFTVTALGVQTPLGRPIEQADVLFGR